MTLKTIRFFVYFYKYKKDIQPGNRYQLSESQNRVRQKNTRHCKVAHQSQSQNGATFPSHIWSIL